MAIEGLNPYIDLRTRTLSNALGITNADELARAESDYAGQRLRQLATGSIRGNFDFDHLKAIHRHIFQDTYEWAGHARKNFDAAKQEYVGGPVHRFTPAADIEKEAAIVFGRLAQDKYLTGLSLGKFVEKAAQLHNDINQLHAFPDGNGRALREYLRQLSVQAGHPIDFRATNQERIIQASIAGHQGDHAPMQRLLTEATDPQRVEMLLKAITFLDGQLGPESVKTMYIATTTPGEQYSGTLVSRAGQDMMFRSHDDKVLIGHSADISPTAKGHDHIQFPAAAAP